MFHSLLNTASGRMRTLAATVALGAAGLAGLSSCGISEQVQQAKAFKGVDVRLVNVEQATLAGIDVTRVRQLSDLSTVQKAALLSGYATGSLPLRLRLNLEFRNPNDETAALNEFDYIALIDGKEVAKGRTTQRIEVPANGGVTTAPIDLNSNLREAVGDQTESSLADFALGLADGDRQPVRLTLKLKPTFITNSGRRISPGGYTTVDKEFRATDLLDGAARRDSAARRP
ncbi:LEA type 2 family protein [Hymenobacter monticola]|uniref:Late embryogenesis abundant protein LEA-2 subgroup domain-containing protein n=1 Tax=Hymenobacter monticola TaxID=1705399 RepID=A0ABY4B4K4_9BACT|nr:LEA type 2 family protein [Hymenobacter monticola]UOE34086.1 hypothetical protein MTP16_00190 [Hymenobacter monticola]